MREILTIPDLRLRQVCSPVSTIRSVEALIAELELIVRRIPGCWGIAAPQVGELVRVAIVRYGEANLLALINPAIIYTKDKVLLKEGCLSIPNRVFEVERPKIVKISYTGIDGRQHSLKGRDRDAQCIMHELNHLDGILIDTLVPETAL